MKDERVVVYLIDKNSNQVCYLRKNHGPKFLIDKLVGFGGKIEPEDLDKDKTTMILNAVKRELKEEIEDNLGINIDLKNLEFIYQGILYEDNIVVHILKAIISVKIPQGLIRSEGEIIYKPITYHQTNSSEFPPNDKHWLNKLFFTNKFFEYRT